MTEVGVAAGPQGEGLHDSRAARPFVRRPSGVVLSCGVSALFDSSYELDRATREAYLTRLGVEDGVPSAAALRLIVQRHVERVPYETLWIPAGQGWSIDPTPAAERIAFDRRGGYCYHLNGALGLLLSSLGYEVHGHVGGVQAGEPNPNAMGNHLVLTVTGLPFVDNPTGEWYVEAGLGDALHEPLPLAPGTYLQEPLPAGTLPAHARTLWGTRVDADTRSCRWLSQHDVDDRSCTRLGLPRTAPVAVYLPGFGIRAGADGRATRRYRCRRHPRTRAGQDRCGCVHRGSDHQAFGVVRSAGRRLRPPLRHSLGRGARTALGEGSASAPQMGGVTAMRSQTAPFDPGGAS